jgi:transposase-like protein
MSSLTAKEIKMAQGCMSCPVCKSARKKQSGLAFWFVKNVEGGLCPKCKAYEKVYGKKAHEPLS